MFVVVLTDEGQTLTGPRAVGPFEDYDVAQAFAGTLVEKWEVQDGKAPEAHVVHVEESYPGVVVGEL